MKYTDTLKKYTSEMHMDISHFSEDLVAAVVFRYSDLLLLYISS